MMVMRMISDEALLGIQTVHTLLSDGQAMNKRKKKWPVQDTPRKSTAKFPIHLGWHLMLPPCRLGHGGV